jgi:hypothetical protein
MILCLLYSIDRGRVDALPPSVNNMRFTSGLSQAVPRPTNSSIIQVLTAGLKAAAAAAADTVKNCMLGLVRQDQGEGVLPTLTPLSV